MIMDKDHLLVGEVQKKKKKSFGNLKIIES